MNGIVTLGETMGLFTAMAIGSLTHVDSFRLGIGGAESNVAIGLSRLGTPATWIGRIGADEIGELVRRELRAEGVELCITVDSEAPTGLMVKSRRTSEHTRVVYHRAASAGSRLEPSDFNGQQIAGAHALHVTGITPALSRSAAAAVDRAVELATLAGVAVSFDVNHRSALWPIATASIAYRSLAERASIVFAGEDEARMICDGETPEELAAGIASLGPTEVIIKLGASGCYALIDGTAYSVPAVPVDAVDTVGAGDAFVAGYLAERRADASPLARLQTAVQAGAFACLGIGDWESLPTRADLELLARTEPVDR